MAKELSAIIAGVADLKGLATLESRIKERNAGTPEIETAIDAKYAEFGRVLVAQKTGFDLSDLNPAEQTNLDKAVWNAA
jgi:hypothetical protein